MCGAFLASDPFFLLLFSGKLVNVLTCPMKFVWFRVPEVFHMASSKQIEGLFSVLHCVHS